MAVRARQPHRPDSAARYPDFFVVGHPKCGTTALYEALRGHPEIFMSAVKEPNYFSIDRSDPIYRSGKPAPVTHANDRGLYLDLFKDAGPEQVVGEGSVFYLWSPTAAAAIAAAQPAARIVAVLREPASFLRSLYLQFAQSGIETAPTFERALELEPQRRKQPRFPSLVYGEYVDYVAQLERYETTFGADRVLVLLFDDLHRDSDAAMRRITRFLGVDERALPLPRVNPTVGVRSTRANLAVHRLRRQGSAAALLGRGLDAVAPRGTRRRKVISARLNAALYGSPEEADSEQMFAVRRRFADQVVRLGERLDRDLVAEWGYRDLVPDL